MGYIGVLNHLTNLFLTSWDIRVFTVFVVHDMSRSGFFQLIDLKQWDDWNSRNGSCQYCFRSIWEKQHDLWCISWRVPWYLRDLPQERDTGILGTGPKYQGCFRWKLISQYLYGSKQAIKCFFFCLGRYLWKLEISWWGWVVLFYLLGPIGGQFICQSLGATSPHFLATVVGKFHV